MSKFTRFLGGPNGPKICGRRTKTDFKDRAVVTALFNVSIGKNNLHRKSAKNLLANK